MSRLINLLIVHCAATANGKENAAQVIDRWHKERGYHCVIDTDGTLLTARDESEVGAHVAGHNATSIGVCMVGTDSFTPAQWATLKSTLLRLRDKYRNAKICGHNQFGNKICPSFAVPDWVDGELAPLPGHIVDLQ
ncbi:N-acetylmuramoyl-L-alanine amidase [Serratia symbiotica]|uniref:N-acetylmuramoyl-L-alanine amidase n=1 Tax=Serratia symbiotica TaxID=138074 RepID=UPI001DC68FE2|nr:N-acetylmuramoyl-L-alanine amidase [Serratia symbiotica]NIG88617.1 N-acetylmuramoyl-L-alanine amidase [Serratia symbiotica]USS96493.1 N-acetylmuramoyl-L-alanine amidase [Serratia symbiotica]